MIELQSVSVQYGSQEALKNVSLRVEDGEFVLLTGPSGCGKSTLVRLLAGLLPDVIPSVVRGEVSVNGTDPVSASVVDMAKLVGVVFQNPATQLFCLTVEEEVAFGPRNMALLEEEVQDRVTWALEAVGLEGLRDRVSAELSGGQQQRLAIASVLAMRPSILVLDEPFASLDVSGLRQVLKTLEDLNRLHGIAVLLAEHRLVEAARIADRIIVMDKGTIAANGKSDDVLRDRALLHRLGIRRPTDEPPEDWIRLLRPNGHLPEGQHPLLELRKVVAGYGGQTVLRGIDLSIFPGEFVALVGSNGAGKSTLARVMAGLLRPKSGKVIFDGGKRSRPGLDVGLLFQNPLDQLLTDQVEEEVAFGPRNWGIFDRRRHESLMEAADLAAMRNHPPLALSSGQQQRTTLAATAATSPRLLILDEPTLGQDWGHLERLMAFVVSLNLHGSTIFLITHDYKLVHRYAERVLLLEGGRITLDGRFDDGMLLAGPSLPWTLREGQGEGSTRGRLDNGRNTSNLHVSTGGYYEMDYS